MRLFGYEPIGGTISVKKYAEFNALRNTIVTKNPEYYKYLHRKSWAIRAFVDIFLLYTPEIMILIDKLMEVEKNGNKK